MSINEVIGDGYGRTQINGRWYAWPHSNRHAVFCVFPDKKTTGGWKWRRVARMSATYNQVRRAQIRLERGTRDEKAEA